MDPTARATPLSFGTARPVLRPKNKRVYYSAQSFDDYAWHRGDSDDSDEEKKRKARLRRRPNNRGRLAKLGSQPGVPIQESDGLKHKFQSDLQSGSKSPSKAQNKNESDKKSHHSNTGDDEDDSDDEHFVNWEKDDKRNPKNWPMRRKWAAVSVVSAFTFISPVSSAIVAPAMVQMSKDLHLNGEIMQAMVMSIFVLAYAVGPLLFGPLSEVYGRTKVLQHSNLFFLIWNLACAFAKTPLQMYVFRFLAGSEVVRLWLLVELFLPIVSTRTKEEKQFQYILLRHCWVLPLVC